ncbi:dTDP-4-dehydrorhamnose 3,5-epimerase [Nitrosarchaeum sp. AC2]|uniref:dTDP-4-dehydrorhamnose 3,5-epimerase n=1 Tax=Nitrosarchaeum sp. AC2 TaxID=2259673 RepID=UPI0015C88A25|nr:dTDP-4-dehydrorhamnose 3,5-epimerase [Nitrosarchaeum sp. AC2]QLH10215.1 dTDP-4-dehydrorhamnose 3,5-epimerase [Nitrosarchaeum sp. AC2]
MKFINMEIEGCIIIEIEKKIDTRGFFARTWDREIFKKQNLNENLSQCSISFNNKKGTIRGIHFQIHPYSETKLVRCTRGSIFDVIIDLRTNSKTFKKWISVELSEENYKMIYMPEGVAHGFQTLENNTEVFYQMTQLYMPEFARGIRWNDPQFNITWPIKSPILSEKDSKHIDFNERSLI